MAKLHAIHNPSPHVVMPVTEKKLTAYCWCGKNLVFVTSADVRKGFTYSCGRRQCTGIKGEVCTQLQHYHRYDKEEQ